MIGICLPVATRVALKSHALDPMATPNHVGAVHRLIPLSRRGVVVGVCLPVAIRAGLNSQSVFSPLNLPRLNVQCGRGSSSFEAMSFCL